MLTPSVTSSDSTQPQPRLVEKVAEDPVNQVQKSPERAEKKKNDSPYQGPQTEALEAKFGANHPLLAVAWCESGHRQYAADGSVLENPAPYSSASGIFQILRITHGPKAAEMGIDIMTPEGNMEFAEYLYEQNGLRDWEESRHCWESRLA